MQSTNVANPHKKLLNKNAKIFRFMSLFWSLKFVCIKELNHTQGFKLSELIEKLKAD